MPKLILKYRTTNKWAFFMEIQEKGPDPKARFHSIHGNEDEVFMVLDRASDFKNENVVGFMRGDQFNDLFARCKQAHTEDTNAWIRLVIAALKATP